MTMTWIFVLLKKEGKNSPFLNDFRYCGYSAINTCSWIKSGICSAKQRTLCNCRCLSEEWEEIWSRMLYQCRVFPSVLGFLYVPAFHGLAFRVSKTMENNQELWWASQNSTIVTVFSIIWVVFKEKLCTCLIVFNLDELLYLPQRALSMRYYSTWQKERLVLAFELRNPWRCIRKSG